MFYFLDIFLWFIPCAIVLFVGWLIFIFVCGKILDAKGERAR